MFVATKKLLSGFMLLVVTQYSFSADGNAASGKELAAPCVACHGEDGNSLAGSFPSIAGQHASYLLKQLRDIKSRARAAPLMAGQLDAMSDENLIDIAAYYSALEAGTGVADPAVVALGEAIFRSGVKRKEVASCSACHSPDGGGNEPAAFPRLAGQWPEYTESQLKAFRSGERGNDGESKMMRLSAMDLSDAEIRAVSSYIRGLR